MTTDGTGDEDRGHRRRRGSQGLKVAQGEVREFGLFACLADVQVRERSRVEGLIANREPRPREKTENMNRDDGFIVSWYRASESGHHVERLPSSLDILSASAGTGTSSTYSPSAYAYRVIRWILALRILV